MGKKEDISSEKKAIIQYLLTNKHSSISEISRKCDISRRTLKRIQDKLKNGLPLCVRRQGKCDRKKKLTPRNKRMLVKIVKENRFATCSAITSKLNEVEINVATITVRRSLHGLSIRSRRPAQKLTKAQRKKCLDSAKKYCSFNVDDWKLVSHNTMIRSFFLNIPVLTFCDNFCSVFFRYASAMSLP